MCIRDRPDPFIQPYTRGQLASEKLDDDDGFDPRAVDEEVRAAAEDVDFFRPRLAHYLRQGCSCPVAALALFEEWQRVLVENGAGRAAQYAHSQHASYKRLSEIEHLSRELLQKLKQQRTEFETFLPPPGAALVGVATPDAAADAGTRLLMLQSLLTAAFSPNFAG